ncbi:MAG TPA: DUF883 domain-containing protein [Methylomirabilota bacterium]|nr:DUF883 domain-containing protein [Methylomirabilota bacterium]
METHFSFTAAAGLSAPREKLVADLKTLVGDLEHLLKAAANELGQKAAADLRALHGRAANLLARAESEAGDCLRAADEVIRSRPYQSIGAAFAVGLLIGVLAGRK